jgi:hypothetical protein
MEPYTLILGNNDISNCDAALVIEGEEVFRVRDDEGILLIDCDMLDDKGERVAKIVRNTPILVADGFRAHIKPGEPTEVVHVASGQIAARFERKGPRHVKISGVFCVKGYCVFMDETGLSTNDAFMVSNNGISGFGTAISMRRGQIGIAFTGTPPHRR